MATQYDSILAPYDYIRTRSIALIESENVHSALAPYIEAARVLELACGSGFYTYKLLNWGAKSVVGMDLSRTMLEAARGCQQAEKLKDLGGGKKVKFVQGDGSEPTLYENGDFDLVFGAWFLNYAPDGAGLVDMFRNVALNLKPGGHFIGVTCPPSSDPKLSVEAEYKARPPPEGSGALYYHVIREVQDGIFFHVHGETPVGNVAFDCYHLRQEVYREAAREAGLMGEISWGVTSVPRAYLRGEGAGGASMRELESYVTVPNYGLLVIEK